MTDVAVVRLPDESRQLEELRRRGIPLLALVAPHAPPFTPSTSSRTGCGYRLPLPTSAPGSSPLRAAPMKAWNDDRS